MKYERGWHIESTPTSALDQRELLVQSGLQSADDILAEFEQHIVPHLGAAYNLARLLCKDADAAQDVVQEAFLRAHRSFAGYRGENARAWILKIVRNCYYSWLMSRRRKSRLEADSDDPWLVATAPARILIAWRFRGSCRSQKCLPLSQTSSMS